MSMRRLKPHEQKLLKKVDFLWQREGNLRELQILRRYHIQDRADYVQYNKVCGMITKLAAKLQKLAPDNDFRIKMTEVLLEKLFFMGLIPTKKSLTKCIKLPAAALCRRRLPIVMVRMKFAETVREAVSFVEQGHVRVGPVVVNDPAYLVTRSMEDHITWVDTSKIRRHVAKFNDKLDDYDMLAGV
jgi:U3 small nucleolar ribonucleoprotein protein IMP3